MKRLAEARFGTSLAWSLAATPGKGQSDAIRFTNISEEGLSIAPYDDSP
jgi:hypothetical protein